MAASTASRTRVGLPTATPLSTNQGRPSQAPPSIRPSSGHNGSTARRARVPGRGSSSSR